MKKIILLFSLIYFIPFAGTSQFTPKSNANTNGNNATNKGTNNSNGTNNNGNNNNPNNDKGKTPTATKTGQVYTATFDDGSKIDYVMITNQAKDENKVTVDLPIFGTFRGDAWNFLSINYYSPEKYFIEGYVGVGFPGVGGNGTGGGIGLEADILYFLTTTSKPKSIRIVLNTSQSGNTITAKVVKQEVPKEVSFGIHGGLALQPFPTKASVDATNQYAGYGGAPQIVYSSAPMIALGIGVFKARHAQWYIPSSNSKILQGTVNTGFYLDALYLPSSTVEANFGVRAYMAGKVSFTKHHEWGLYYQLGLMFLGNNTNPSMGGFGPYITF